VRNASYLALLFGVLFAAGCGKSGIAPPRVEADTFKDSQYYQSLRGMGSTVAFGDLLAGLAPADRAKYIRKSAEEESPARIYGLKAAYERFVNDPDPEVAAAAKEALAKVPSKDELEALNKEELEKLKPQ
jgi:hypothetical protein